MNTKELNQAFINVFGTEADATFFSPGRINLIGEHTDYNGGHVFPAAITLGTYGAARKRDDKVLRFYSANFDDLGIIEPNCGDLTKWAKEGVLLLNSSLTVIKDCPNSHQNIGWSNLTDYIIKKINQKEEPVVFILWGNFAKSKKVFITNPKHLVLTSPHPSPFSARYGFFGSHPFSKTNEFLEKNGEETINWDLN